jgi:hypothetical protein
MYGTEVTKQEVPIPYVVATYLSKRFLYDSEKEFICLLHEVPFDYQKSIPKT